MATLHKIRAWLYDNYLTQDNPNDFIARVNAERALGISDICRSAAERGGADIPADAMDHAVNLFFKEMGYRLCDGFSVNTGWFTAGVHIRGVFDSPQETFNPEKHTLLFELHQGALLRNELELVSVEILGVAETGTTVLQVTDVKTGSVNDLLTPNRNLKVSGQKIRVEGNDASVGIYFVNQSTQERTRVDASDIVVNNPSELIIVTPNLAPDVYHLEITTQFSSTGRVLKAPRSVIFDKPLTVAP
jgi:hypothetical protein